MDNIIVIKVGGNEIDETTFLVQLCSIISRMEQPLILVHGGGKEISAALERYGEKVQFIEGLRVTPPTSMAIMEMVVCGSINKRIVAGLVQTGARALGMSGVDLGILRCQPHRPNGIDLGRVGTVTAVDVTMLRSMLQVGWLPVIAPVALGQDDALAYNVNADHIAEAIAIALTQGEQDITTTELVFVSNVPGVILNDQVVAELTVAEIDQGIQAGMIIGGMLPKVRAACMALARGVTSVRITNLEGLIAGGTRIM